MKMIAMYLYLILFHIKLHKITQQLHKITKNTENYIKLLKTT